MVVLNNNTGTVTPGGLWHPNQKGVWESAKYTVPVNTPEDKIDFHADKYVQRAGEAYEKRGFQVLQMEKPRPDKMPIGVEPDRKSYVIWIYVRRKPQQVTINVPDASVPTLLRQGMKLI